MAESPIPADADPQECHVVDVPDVGPVRVHGGPLTEQDAAYFAEVAQAARRRYIAENGDPQ